MRIRIQANGLSTATNWLTNFMVVMVTPPGIAHIGWGMYAIFGVLCAAQIPIIVSVYMLTEAPITCTSRLQFPSPLPSQYKFFPETKGRSLEELDVIWAYAYEERTSVVVESLRIKRLEGDELDEWIARYLATGPMGSWHAQAQAQAHGLGSDLGLTESMQARLDA